MIEIRGIRHIEGHPPEAVFEAGIRVSNLPKELDHVTLTAQGTKRNLELGSQLDLVSGISLPLLGTLAVRLEARVVEFIPGEVVVIEGEADQVDAALTLHLSEFKRGTRTTYDLSVGYKANRLKRLLIEEVIKELLKPGVEQFSDIYTENITRSLGATAAAVPTIRQPRHTKPRPAPAGKRAS